MTLTAPTSVPNDLSLIGYPMPMHTELLASPFHVLQLSHGFKMLRIYTTLHKTQVIQLKPGWNRSNQSLVHHSVSDLRRVPICDLSIASHGAPGVQPTTAVPRLNASKHPFMWG